MVRAFITGITGQDGSYLAEHLLERKYEVHGLIRPGCDVSETHLSEHADEIGFHSGDLIDGAALERAISVVGPDEIAPETAWNLWFSNGFNPPPNAGGRCGR